MSKIAAVVVTYNRKELLMENIQSLLNQKPEVPDILIIDNHSTDGTFVALKDLIAVEKRIKYYDTGSNLGGAGGFSYGIRKAVESSYDYLWIMDDDCIPFPDAMEAFMKADEQLQGEYGFLSSKVLWKDGSLCTMNIQRHPLTKNITKFDEELIPATLASFVSLFVKRKTVEQLGLPIKEFFIWTDDWEYTRRISRKYDSYVVPQSIVTHKCKSNIGANISNDDPERLSRYKYLYRNDVYLYRREGISGFAYEIVRLCVHILKVLFKSKDYRLERLKMIFGGTLEGLRFNPQIEFVKDEQ